MLTVAYERTETLYVIVPVTTQPRPVVSYGPGLRAAPAGAPGLGGARGPEGVRVGRARRGAPPAAGGAVEVEPVPIAEPDSAHARPALTHQRLGVALGARARPLELAAREQHR